MFRKMHVIQYPLYPTVGLFCFLLVAYCVLSIQMSYVTGASDILLQELNNLRTEVGTIETSYFEHIKNVNLEKAYALGFRDNTKEAVFITRNSQAAASLGTVNGF